jgi:lipopolysaccharide/colanic/teichoic acid biosynthesis glycosyltransferase
VLELGEIIDKCKADTVLLWGNLTDKQFGLAVDAALAAGCRLLAPPRSYMSTSLEPSGVCLEGVRLVQLNTPGLQAWQQAAKRAIDIAGSLGGLLLLSPIIGLIALWVKLDSPGSVIFAQERLGRHGRRFRCYKFRSMKQNAEQLLISDPEMHDLYVASDFKLPEEKDPRLTRSGRFLRKTSLDELPQLVNVLLGQMSLIGPRPIVPKEIEHYEQGAPLFLSLRPGMTGAWAVNGRSQVSYPHRAHLELEYVRKWSLLKDVSILARTLPAVFLKRGAH